MEWFCALITLLLLPASFIVILKFLNRKRNEVDFRVDESNNFS